MRRLDRAISTLDRGFKIASEIEYAQAFRRVIAMLVGMPLAVAGLLFCGVFYNGWQGNGVWYGVVCLGISGVTIRSALNQIETHCSDLQVQLFDQILQRNRVQTELDKLYEKRANYPRVRNPIDVKGAA